MGDVTIFEPERSNHVQRLTYNPDTEDLTVTFKNGAGYSHTGVPSHVFAAMTRHPSTGQYYHKVIKRHYPQRTNGSSN